MALFYSGQPVRVKLDAVCPDSRLAWAKGMNCFVRGPYPAPEATCFPGEWYELSLRVPEGFLAAHHSALEPRLLDPENIEEREKELVDA